MAYTEKFKLVLFFIGNGCETSLIRRWTMLAQLWEESTTKAEKGARQVDFVLKMMRTRTAICGSTLMSITTNFCT